MKDTFSVKLNRDFHRAFKKGTRKGGRFLAVYAVKNNREKSRLGITVGKKFGNSVQRNRFKRLVRECFRSVLDEIPGHYDIIVVAKASERAAMLPSRKLRALSIPTYAEVRKDLLHALRSLEILKTDGGSQ